MNTRETLSISEVAQDDLDAENKKRGYAELREEVIKEKGMSKKLTNEERMMVEQEIHKKELLAGWAKLIFEEDGSVRLEPTVEQIDDIKSEWKKFVNDTKECLVNASDDFLKKQISDLQHGRRRNIADKFNYKFDPVNQVNNEQLLLAVYKEILKEREEKREVKEE